MARLLCCASAPRSPTPSAPGGEKAALKPSQKRVENPNSLDPPSSQHPEPETRREAAREPLCTSFFFIDFGFCLAAEVKRGQDSAGNTREDSWRERDSPGNAATAPVVGAQAGARGAGDAPVCKEQAARTPPARSGLGGGGGRPRGRARAAAAPGRPPLCTNPAPWPGPRDPGDASSQLTKPTRPANKTTNATLRLKACRTGTAFPGHGVTFL